MTQRQQLILILALLCLAIGLYLAWLEYQQEHTARPVQQQPTAVFTPAPH